MQANSCVANSQYVARRALESMGTLCSLLIHIHISPGWLFIFIERPFQPLQHTYDYDEYTHASTCHWRGNVATYGEDAYRTRVSKFNRKNVNWMTANRNEKGDEKTESSRRRWCDAAEEQNMILG